MCTKHEFKSKTKPLALKPDVVREIYLIVGAEFIGKL